MSNLFSTDIRKPANQASSTAIQRSTTSHSNSHTPLSSDVLSQELELYTEPLSDDEPDDEYNVKAATEDEAGWADLPAQVVAEAKKFRDEHQDDRDPVPFLSKPSTGKNNGRGNEVFTKLTPANLTKMMATKFADNDGGADGDEDLAGGSTISVQPRVEYVSSFRAQAGKRVAIPVRVEPKVFFANERTSMYFLTLCFRFRLETDSLNY